MPILSVTVMDEFLDLTVESRTWELVLFDADPSLDGVELDDVTAPGYAPASIAPVDWAPADSGEKSLTAPAEVGTPTDAWIEAGYWGLRDPSTGELGDYGPLTEPLAVTEASPDGPLVAPVVFYADSVEPLD